MKMYYCATGEHQYIPTNDLEQQNSTAKDDTGGGNPKSSYGPGPKGDFSSVHPHTLARLVDKTANFSSLVDSCQNVHSAGREPNTDSSALPAGALRFSRNSNINVEGGQTMQGSRQTRFDIIH